MNRYALRLEYVGAPFAGWQRQSGQPSVQGAIEEALGRLEAGPHTIAGAGRTDAGVHAIGQVAHCDLQGAWEPFRLGEALNHHLKPLPVAVIGCAQVAPDWHARFSAVERRYLFRLLLRRAPAAIDAGLAWQSPRRLDLQAMREAAAHLVGRHDFTTFRSSICQARSVKTLDAFEIDEVAGLGGPELRFPGAGALLSAPSGALDDRHAGAGRRRGLEPGGREGGAGGGRPRRLRSGLPAARPLPRPCRLSRGPVCAARRRPGARAARRRRLGL